MTRRFPVLAHWEFTCSDDAGDFAGYMNHLDVGLFGTAPIDDPRARVVPVTPTGHVSIEHTNRRGDTGNVWYRGPFTPSKITREPAGKPYHVADQARRIGPDGREDVSYAAAFEVGRLLALSDLQFLRGLRVWAREEFAVRRQDDVILPSFGDLQVALPFDVDLPRVLSRDLLTPGGIGGDPLTELGAALPIHEAELLFQPSDTAVLATGLGLETQIVAATLGTDVSASPVDSATINSGLRTFDELLGATAELGVLHDHLAAAVDDVRARGRATRRRGGGGTRRADR